MGTRRVVIPRLTDPKSSKSNADATAGGESSKVDAPSLSAIHLVFGVGKGVTEAPDAKTFKPVYTVSIPVFSLGGLDSDGVYEFDASALLGLLQGRAQRRKWAVRLELQLLQTADSVSAADVYVTTPYPDSEGEGAAEGLAFEVLGRSGGGKVSSGGGRTIALASGLVHAPADIVHLGGDFSVQVADSDPRGDDPPRVASAPRPVRLNFTQYEFEG